MAGFTTDDVRRQLTLLGIGEVDDEVLKRFVERISTPRMSPRTDFVESSAASSPEMSRKIPLREYLSPPPPRIKMFDENRRENRSNQDTKEPQTVLEYDSRESGQQFEQEPKPGFVEQRPATANTSGKSLKSSKSISFNSTDPVSLFQRFKTEWQRDKKQVRRRPASSSTSSLLQRGPTSRKQSSKISEFVVRTDNVATQRREDSRIRWHNRSKSSNCT
uniref:Uncharacterized protein n=1 Tax=Spongospora subterranea TaxID=70186 RepID=A0A0H5QYN8_9EUKA|eukprot:CRZ00689.1 hypothetical protein [Spongospora subterranea]